MSDNERNRVLTEIRRALGRKTTMQPAPLLPFDHGKTERWNEGLVIRFKQVLEATGGKVHEARDAEEVAACIAQICHRAAATEVALSGSSLLQELNLAAQLALRQLSVSAADEFAHRSYEEVIAHLARCDVGVTAVEDALAETGTLSLSSDEQHALLVSLLPPIHIAVLQPHQIKASLAEVLSQLKAERTSRQEPAQSATFITGPSRTGDIELTLSVGVHGPKELHAIILADQHSIGRAASSLDSLNTAPQ